MAEKEKAPIKRIKNLTIGNRTYYEYDNGVKVYYTKVKNTQKHDIELKFNGGASIQGDTIGLAHLVEHAFLNDAELATMVYNGTTSKSNTTYYASLSQNKVDCATHNYLKSKGIIDRSNQEGLTEEQKKELRTEYAKEEKKVETKYIQQRLVKLLKTFFGEVKKDYTDYRQFEDEKTIIDIEMNRTGHAHKYANKSAHLDYMLGVSRHYICGDYASLKDATVQDYVKFKQNNYTKENMVVDITSSLEYQDIEPVLIGYIDVLAPSNANNVCSKGVDRADMVEDAYFVNKNNNGGETEDYASVLFSIVVDKNRITEKEQLFIGALMFWFMFGGNRQNLLKLLREDMHLVYAVGVELSSSYSKQSYDIDVDVQKQNINQALRAIAHNINLIVQEYDPEPIYQFKKKMTMPLVEDYIARFKDYDFWQNFSPEYRKHLFNLIQDGSIDYLRDCLQKFAQTLNVHVTVSNNVDVYSLLDIDYLKGLVNGKSSNPLVVQEAEKKKNTKQPIILDCNVRELPQVTAQSSGIKECETNGR